MSAISITVHKEIMYIFMYYMDIVLNMFDFSPISRTSEVNEYNAK